jgi:natural product biosynthesis luciferase-like monooxygenase protein
MKYGVFHLFDYHPDLHGSEAETYRHLLEQSVEAEAMGYDAVWCAEHHFTRYGGLLPSPLIWATAVARETRRIRLGLAVSLLPYHRPVRIAEDVAMVDLLSDGRLDFGVGRGFVKWEYENLGVVVEQSRQHFHEGLEVILKAWTSDTFDHEGPLFRYQGLSVRPHPLQKPHPSIWVAATTTPETFRWTGEQGYNLMVVPFLSEPDILESLIGTYRTGVAAAGVARSEIFGAMHVYVHEDNERALAQGDVYFRNYLAANAEANAHGRVAGAAPPTPIPGAPPPHAVMMQRFRQMTCAEMVAEERLIIGDPEHCAAMLLSMQRRYGITQVGGQFNFGGMPHDEVLRSMRLFREQVVPRVEAAALAEAGTA